VIFIESCPALSVLSVAVTVNKFGPSLRLTVKRQLLSVPSLVSPVLMDTDARPEEGSVSSQVPSRTICADSVVKSSPLFVIISTVGETESTVTIKLFEGFDSRVGFVCDRALAFTK